MQVRAPSRVYRTWGMDSRRWESFRPRRDDIVIATYPKCGTTWMQRIVSLLVFRDPAPIRLMDVSPWLDCRFVEPVEATLARLEAMRHRRFIKSHLPADGLPFFDELRYIVVARDGRDACLSYHNHVLSYTPWMLARLDAAGVEDGTGPFPRALARTEAFFHRWLTQGIPLEPDGLPLHSYFGFQRAWWRMHDQANVLLLHYADLKADLPGAMRRVADFLGIVVPNALWPTLIEAASFGAMRRAGDTLLGRTRAAFRGGGDTFFHHGENGRWHGRLELADLRLYEAKIATLPEDGARWLAAGSATAAEERPPKR
jgi:aryl sulfotransferase